MCTVTYVPVEGGFVFTSNRDEDPKRSAHKIIEDTRERLQLVSQKTKGHKGPGLRSRIKISLHASSMAPLNLIFEKKITA